MDSILSRLMAALLTVTLGILVILAFIYIKKLFTLFMISQHSLFAVLKKQDSMLSKRKKVDVFEVQREVPSQKHLSRLQERYEG